MANEAEAVARGGGVLGGVTSQTAGIVLNPALHVRLEWTTLADFVEHFERALCGGNPGKILGDNLGMVVWDDEPHPENGKYTRVRPISVGTTGKNYWIFEGGNGEDETQRALVQVARFSQRRLRVSLHEPSGGYAEHFETWLRDNWEDDVSKNEPKKASDPDYSLAPSTKGRPRDSWNQRAIDRLLAGEDSATVRADWCVDYEDGARIHPSATDDGEEKTWQRRVLNPYQKEMGAKGAK